MKDWVNGMIYIVMILLVLTWGIAVTIWKWTSCKHEGLSNNYCLSRMF